MAATTNKKMMQRLFAFLVLILFIGSNGLLAQTTIVVSQKGKADFTSIQAAINSLPADAKEQRIILIKKGTYNEKLFIDKNFITLKGESPKTTCIVISLARDEWRCSNPDDYGTATINLKGNDIILENLSFVNNYGKDNANDKTIDCANDSSGKKTIKPTGHQMSLRSFGTTRLKAINCVFTAYGGDTVSPWNTDDGMFYFKDCVMEGGVDFYCPRGWALALNCTFICHNKEAAIWHDGSKNKDSKTVLVNCNFKGDEGFGLGRYHRDAQFYLFNCSFSKEMANADIFQRAATPPNVLQWGRRLYYYNCHRSGGDYAWHQDNLPATLNNASITTTWPFDGQWQPDEPKELVQVKMVSPVSVAPNNAAANTDPVAEKMLLFQRSYGGWPKHYKDKAIDYNATYSESELAGIKDDKNRNDATIDNKATTKEIIYLVKAYKTTQNKDYLTAAENGILYLLKAQYKNGGWPQFYPDLSSYRHLITFNDNAMVNVLNVLQDVAEQKNNMELVDASLIDKCKKAVQKGIDIMLDLQIKQGGQLTAWCAQHDDITYAPAKARAFELASISGQESVGIVEFLMRQPNPSKRIITAIKAAVQWFEKSKIENMEYVDVDDPTQPNGKDRVARSKQGSTIWARFYDLETNQPFFCGRNGIKQTILAAVEHERRVGYAWYGTWPNKILNKLYPEWRQRNNVE
jgi:PelA/Pel-15E family pectate lyase